MATKELNATVKLSHQEVSSSLPPQLSTLMNHLKYPSLITTIVGQFAGEEMRISTEDDYKYFKTLVANTNSLSCVLFAEITLPVEISSEKGVYHRSSASVTFRPHEGFDEEFMKGTQAALKASLRSKADADVAKKLSSSSRKKKRDQDESEYTIYFKNQSQDLIPFRAENLNKKTEIESIVFVKCFSYTSFTFSSLLDDHLIFPNFTLNDILNSEPGQISLPGGSTEQMKEALERVASTFNMNYIVGLIADYLGLFQATLDTSRLDNEADRRVIINIFLMVASAMASLAFSVEVDLKSNIQEKRLGTGPLDYFLQPQEAEIRSDIKAKLFNQPSSVSLSSIAKMNDLTSQVVIQTGAPPTEEQLMELQEEEEEEEEDIGHIVYEGGEQVQEVYVAPSSSDQAAVVKARPLSILEAKSDCLMISGNLDHSLGQLLAQMIDAMKVPEVKRKQSKYLWIKGLLSTGQRTLFFSMRKDKDSEHSLPEVFYHGQVVIQVLPFISNRTSGHNMDENLTIRSEQVLAMIKNLYVFLTTDMETSSSEESMKTVKKAETDP